jgi:hypothetical protein
LSSEDQLSTNVPDGCGSRVALKCFNNTVALYVLGDRQFFLYVFAMDIEVWLYRRWFQPYITDIEFDRSFAQVFAVHYDKTAVKGVGSMASRAYYSPLRRLRASRATSGHYVS